MAARRDSYTITDLEQQTGVPVRTIRFYVAQDLLPPPRGRGPHATYNEGHLTRLRLIQALKQSLLTLEEIKERAASLSDDEIAQMFAVAEDSSEERWRHIRLHPDAVLLVREGADRDGAFAKGLARVLATAREALPG